MFERNYYSNTAVCPKQINTRASYVRSSVIEYAEFVTALLEAELEEARNPKPSFFQWLFGK
jgi:hypothetical protein